jgi:hypothetical protein
MGSQFSVQVDSAMTFDRLSKDTPPSKAYQKTFTGFVQERLISQLNCLEIGL